MSNTKTNPNDFIAPTTLRQVGENEFRVATPADIKNGMYLFPQGGLTKREHFTSMAMQAICAHHDTWGLDSLEKIAIASTEMADALIEQLNKQ